MNKVICDVCGTAYPETADQCPICGCAKPADAHIVAENAAENASVSNYTYVKGGRFSNKNVKKRNKAKQAGASAPMTQATKQAAKQDVPVPQNNPEPEMPAPKSNMPLVITAIVLLLAIVATVIFIAVRFFPNFFSGKKPAETIPTTVATQPIETETTAAPTIPCESISLDTPTVQLYNVGDSHLLMYDIQPADTTDTLSFESSDENIATVNSEGKITAVASGEATITVTCGDIAEVVVVICDIAPETTVPETTEAVKLTDEEFHFNREDFTLSYIGETWDLFDGTFTRSMITWTSDNEGVATIKDGVVTAQGVGSTEVHAQFNDQIITCIVRVG